MKHSHTPGPWTIDEGMHLHIRGNLSNRKHMAHEETVARVFHSDDAQLIAAAPDLLESLESIIGDFLGGSDVLTVERINQAVLAINKARGET